MRKQLIRFIQMFISPLLSWINKRIPKKERIVLYSNLGFRDNIDALYEYLVANGYNNRYEIICVSNDFYNNKKKFRYTNVRTCSPFFGVFYYFSSKFFFFCFGKYPIYPSKDQFVINLLHGMPIKKIGLAEEENTKIKYDYFNYAISYSNFFSKYIEDSFGITQKQIFISGSPRLDLFKRKQTICNNKSIIWMPTYRDNAEDENTTWSSFDLRKVQDKLVETDITLIIKPHPLDAFFNIKNNYKNIIVINEQFLSNKNIDLYSLLASTSALITDYSSVAIDYLFLNRPIGYVLLDEDRYTNSRGFNFTFDKVKAGEVIHDTEELIKFISDIAEGKDTMKTLRNRISSQILTEDETDSYSKKILEFVGVKHE